MKQFKKILSLVFTILLMNATCMNVFAAESVKDTAGLHMEVIIRSNEVQPLVNLDEYASKSYTFDFVDTNEKVIATYKVVAKGVYSQVDRGSEMYDMEVQELYNTDSRIFPFTYSSTVNGNKGLVVFYLNGLTAGVLEAIISYNGSITFYKY